MTLLEMIKEYNGLLNRKEDLEAQTKANNAAIQEAKEQIAQQMVDDDCQKISAGGYSYSLITKTAYTKRSDADLAAAGLDFLDVLREEGFGDIIKETVNPRTLQSAVANFVAENGELTEELNSVLRTYEYSDINRRREIRKKNGGINR